MTTPTATRAEATTEANTQAGIRRWDLLGYAVYALGAVLIVAPLWRDPAGRILFRNYQDQVFFEWILTHATHAWTHHDNPLFTDLLNAPYGVNLLANTNVLALAIPLIPVTVLFGPHMSFAALVTLGLAGTAAAWYYVLSRHLLNSRAAAFVGGTFCGFAPAMISHSNSHPNITGQYLIPFIVLAVLRLREPGAVLRKGLVLAALVVGQVFINEEMLFLTALALAAFVAAYAAFRPREIRSCAPHALRALGVAVGVAGVVLAYPLYWQFRGPQHYRGLQSLFGSYGADLVSFWSFSRRSVAGDAASVDRLRQAATEENTFFGWPLLVALVAVVVWLATSAVVRALATTAVSFGALSLGSEIQVSGVRTTIPGPWKLVDKLPLFDSVVPTRLALVITPIVGCLLALAVDRFGDSGLRVRAVAGAAVSAVLLPLLPTPLQTIGRPQQPVFFTTQAWRQHVPTGAVLLAIPPGGMTNLTVMQWQTATNQRFRTYGGYFLAPYPGRPHRGGMFGPVYPPTMTLLSRIGDTGEPVTVTAQLRMQAAADLRGIGVTAIVLPTGQPHANALRSVLDRLVGPGTAIEDVWLWDVRAL